MFKNIEGKTILQIVSSLDVGGPERSTLDVAASIVRAGGRSFVISAGGRMVEELERSGAVHFSWEAGSKDPRVMWKNHGLLKDFVRMEKVDLVHVRNRAPAWSAYLATRENKVPMVTTMHSTFKSIMPWDKLYNSIMTKGDRVIAISHYMAKHIEETYGIEKKRIAVIPRGIDLAVFNRTSVSDERKRVFAASILLPENKPFILFPARLMPIKGQALALEALSKIKESFSCLIVGPDPDHKGYREHLKNLKRKYMLEDKVTFLDHVDLPAAYALADVVLSPSQIAESFGRVPAEAQAMGVPVIASNLGATLETVVDGETGWLVPVGDADALANTIRKAITLPKNDRAAMADKAMAHARAHFDIRQMCDKTLLTYCELLS